MVRDTSDIFADKTKRILHIRATNYTHRNTETTRAWPRLAATFETAGYVASSIGKHISPASYYILYPA